MWDHVQRYLISFIHSYVSAVWYLLIIKVVSMGSRHIETEVHHPDYLSFSVDPCMIVTILNVHCTSQLNTNPSTIFLTIKRHLNFDPEMSFYFKTWNMMMKCDSNLELNFKFTSLWVWEDFVGGLYYQGVSL